MNRLLFLLPFLLLVVFFAACGEKGDKALSFFLDIPPPSPEERAEAEKKEAAAPAEAKAKAGAAVAVAPVKDEGPLPEIESVFKWARAKEMLAKDDDDELDWMKTLREGIIRPRAAVDGSRHPDAATFRFDFFLPGPEPDFDALFPHSAHTQWLGCDSCHPRIFRIRGTKMTMDEILEGKFCGVCHGRVAFSLDLCARCHTAMAE